MASTNVASSHITLNENGRVLVDGHFKLKILVREHIAGLSPTEIRSGRDQLSLAGVHSALAYYYDHKSEIDAELKADDEFVNESERQARASGGQLTRAVLEQRLRDKGINL